MMQPQEIIIIELSALDATLINLILSRSRKMNQMENEAAERFILQTTDKTSDELFEDVILQMGVRTELHNLGITTGL